MNHLPKPDTATATFIDGPFTIRLSIPAEDAASWRTATTAAILDHLGLGDGGPGGPGQGEEGDGLGHDGDGYEDEP